MKKSLKCAWFFAILASLAMYAFAIWFGEVNQDEGWYLYAGRLVSEGQHPFIDFASTQGPVMAYVYALAQPLVRLWGVAGGRLFTAILGFSTALAAALLAYRIAEATRIGIDKDRDKDRDKDSESPTFSSVSSPCHGVAEGEDGCSNSPPGSQLSTVHNSQSKLPISAFPFQLSAFLTFSLLSLNLYHVYFTSMVKTYSLAGLLVVLGFLCLEKALRKSNAQHPGDPVNPVQSRLSPLASPHSTVDCSLPASRSPSASSVTSCSNPHTPLPTVLSLPSTSPVLLAFFAAASFALAAGVRLSAGILLPTIWLALFFRWVRGCRSRQGLAILVGFLLGGSAVLLAIYVPFMIAAPEALKFGLLDYHGGRTVGSLVVALAYKAGFLIRLTGAYFPLVALAVGCWALDVGRSMFAPNPLPPDSPQSLPSATSATSCSNQADDEPPSPRSAPHSTPATCNALSSHSTACPSKLGERSRVPPSTVHSPLPIPRLLQFQLSNFSFLLYCALAAVTLVHLLAIFPYDDYQVFIMPLLAVLVAVAFSRISRSTLDSPHPPLHFNFLLSVFSFLLLLHSAASPLLQNWLLAERDRIWWPLRTESSLHTLQRAAKTVRELAAGEGTRIGTRIGIDEDRDSRSEAETAEGNDRDKDDSVPSPPVQRLQRATPSTNLSLSRRSSWSKPDPISAFKFQLSTLLTQDTYLAVEAGLRVPAGMELGPFCYFPAMTREQAEARHVLNREMLHELLLASTDASVAAFSGYGLSIRCPEITQLPVDEQVELWRMVESRYEQVAEIKPFGQADTTLRVFGRK